MISRQRLARALPPLFLLLAGFAFAWVGSSYRIGSLTTMGAGFLPLVLGVVLAALALALLFAPAPAEDAGKAQTGMPWRTLLCVVAGVVVWTLLVERVGFLPAALAQLLLSALALPGHHGIRTLAGSIALALAAWLLFVGLLGLPLRAFGG